MRNPICAFRTLWRSIKARAFVSGHDFVIDDEPTPANVQVLKCTGCGCYSIGWNWPR